MLQLRNDVPKFTPKVSLQSLVSTKLNIMEKAIKNPRKAEETMASANALAHADPLTLCSACTSPMDRVHLPGDMEDAGLCHIRPFPIPGPLMAMATLGTMGKERSLWATEIVSVFVY